MSNTDSLLDPNLYPLIIECCHVEPDFDRIVSLASHITDWDQVIKSSYAHGIFPLVAKSLKSTPYIPNDIRRLLKLTTIDIAQHNMQKSVELSRILKLLEKENIPALTIKGPVLSQILYGNITDRQYSDLDIVIDESDMFRAVELLVGVGYVSEHSIGFLHNCSFMKVAKDFTIYNPTNGIIIEIHWRLFLDKQAIDGNIQLFSDDIVQSRIAGCEMATMNIVTNLLYLLLHGSNHFWERLEWIADIDRLIRKFYTDIDWANLIKRAEKMEIEELVFLGLSLCHRLMDTPLDSGIVETISHNKAIQTAQQKIISDIYQDSITNPTDHLVSMETLRKMGLLRDKHNRWIKQYFLNLFQINELDIYQRNLPEALHSLYYPLRIWRLFKLNVLRWSPKR